MGMTYIVAQHASILSTVDHAIREATEIQRCPDMKQEDCLCLRRIWFIRPATDFISNIFPLLILFIPSLLHPTL
jgi:hypothetical protein